MYHNPSICCLTINLAVDGPQAMPIPNPSLPKVPAPTKVFFDPFNSSSTGHQRAENRLSGSRSWRDSRTYKLANQLGDSTGRGGSKHIADLVGAGSVDFGKDGRKENGDWEKGAPGLRETGWQDIRGMMCGEQKKILNEAVNTNAPRHNPTQTTSENFQRHSDTSAPAVTSYNTKESATHDKDTNVKPEIPPKELPQFFKGLTIYLNGSTAPLISDHKLKILFVSHGGRVCLGLARRSVTHVILGKTGLASGKIQKEVQKIRGESVRFVTAQWVVDSVEAGRRKDEGAYLPKNLGIGGSRQKSVGDMFSRPKKG